MKDKWVIKKDSFVLLIASFLGFFLWFLGILTDYQQSKVVSIFLLFLSVVLVIWSRSNYLLVIMFSIMAYCNYSVVVSDYLSLQRNTIFTMYAGTYICNKAIYILLLFTCVLGLLLSITYKNDVYNIQIDSEIFKSPEFGKNSQIVVIGIDIILIFILIFAFGRPTQLGDRGTPSTIYEYSIILFILSFFWGAKNKKITNITMIILLLFALQNFVYGGRITGLQLLIVAYVMVIESKIKIKKALPLIVAVFLVLSIIGVARGNLLTGNFRVSEIVNGLKQQKFALDTAYSAYHTSLTFIFAEEHTHWETRIGIFMGFLKSIILGKYNTVDSNVASYTAQFYRHYGGGVLPYYFEFYLGTVGVCLIAIYLSVIIKKLRCVCGNSRGYVKCLCVYVVASSFRWYLYSPIQITRGVLLLFICYKIVEKIVSYQK